MFSYIITIWMIISWLLCVWTDHSMIQIITMMARNLLSLATSAVFKHYSYSFFLGRLTWTRILLFWSSVPSTKPHRPLRLTVSISKGSHWRSGGLTTTSPCLAWPNTPLCPCLVSTDTALITLPHSFHAWLAPTYSHSSSVFLKKKSSVFFLNMFFFFKNRKHRLNFFFFQTLHSRTNQLVNPLWTKFFFFCRFSGHNLI